MLRFTRCRRDFRSQKLSDISTALIGRNREHGIDHVAVDVGSFLATGMGICKGLVGPERDSEIAKYVAKNVAAVVLKKVRPVKSLAFFFDGTDPLWKIRIIRKIANKSSASRYTRAAGSPLPFVVEDKLRLILSDNRGPEEFVVSGAATPGPVESKISAWGLDLASRPGVKASDSIALVGGWDLAYSGLALTPFYNVSTVTIDRGDVKHITMQDLGDWLAIADVVRNGDNAALSRVRTDIVLVYLLTNSVTATGLTGVPNTGFKDVMEAYLEHCVAKESYLTVDVEPKGVEDGAHSFESTVGVNAKRLADFLMRASKKGAIKGKLEADGGPVYDYLEQLLQNLAMFADGGLRNHGFFSPKVVPDAKVAVPMDRLIAHLLAVSPDTVLRCSADESFALTAAEQVLMGALTPEMVDGSLPAFTKGHTLPLNVAEKLIAKTKLPDALETTRKLLAPAASQSAHRAFTHSPTHVWVRKPGETGPTPGYAYASVNLGERSRTAQTRLKHNQLDRAAGVAAAKVKNALVSFDTTTNTWAETDVRLPGNALGSQLKLVTWNVQFDRFSGQTTPLGKPGIDWCSKTRYVALAKVLQNTDADIIAMQETEPTWWEFLSRQQWVQQNYAFSCPMRGEPITPWGQVMLVNRRLPVVNMAAHNVPGYTGHTSVMPLCSLEVKPGVNLNVCGIHLLAPYTQSNINVRVTQIEALMKRLSPKNVGEDVVVMGDFNDYPSNFFVMPSAMGAFRDAWVEANGDQDGDAGYTINGLTSKYTSLIIEPEFFGRADRMLVKSRHLKVAKSELIGTRSVREELNVASCPEYLFPSDHYGILTTLDVGAAK